MKIEFKKYIESYKRYGFIGIINKIFSKLKIKIIFNDPIQKKRIYLSKKINELCNSEVIDGIYKSTKFNYSSDFFIAKPAQLLGCYEKEVQEKIFELGKKHNLDFLISVGAGEGYHAVGSVACKLLKYSICFELDENNRSIIKKNFHLNKIFENFDIYGKADNNFIDSISNKIDLKKSLFLVDIEGDEFKILDEKNLEHLKNSYLIIEIHHFYSTEKKYKNLLENLEKNFNLEFIKTENRQYSNFKILNKFNDDEKWLMMSESRPATMQWIICKPFID
jgi:hypothetical protein